MKPEIKDAWVKALRSGEYTQGRSGLITADGGFCCLGVLCDLAYKEGVVSRDAFAVDEEGNRIAGGFEGGNGYLPQKVAVWADLMENERVAITGSHFDVTLGENLASELNDQGASFDDIADLIEKRL